MRAAAALLVVASLLLPCLAQDDQRKFDGEYLNSGDEQSPLRDAPTIASLAYLRTGSGDFDADSRPFNYRGSTALIIAAKGRGIYGHLFAKALTPDERNRLLTSSQLLNLKDGEPAKATVKLNRRPEQAEAYVDLGIIGCDWLVAVVNFERLPSSDELDQTVRAVLSAAHWPADTAVAR